jgi:hypothetical protein
MSESQPTHAAELERQQLVKQAHCLVAAIASRPGAIKLLRGVIPMLEIYAGYKANRMWRRQRGSG